MNMETQEFVAEGEENLPFEVRQIEEGKTAYIFEGVTIGIDSTGKNYAPLPEIVFGQFDNETGKGSFEKARASSTLVDMDYIARCIKEVARSTGISTFWFYPYGDDDPTGNNERRERARMKLFGQLASSIVPAPSSHGYILTV